MFGTTGEMTAVTRGRQFQVIRQDDITVVIFGLALRNLGERDLEGVSRQLLQIAEPCADPPWMILDLAATEYFGSPFIEILVQVWKRIHLRKDARFAIGGLQEYCREVLEVTKFDRLIPLFATRDKAVAALSLPVVRI